MGPGRERQRTGRKNDAPGLKTERAAQGQHSDDGEVEIETTHSPEGKQEAQRSYRENYARYRRMSEAVLDSERSAGSQLPWKLGLP